MQMASERSRETERSKDLLRFITCGSVDQDTVRSLVQPSECIEVFVDTPIDECMRAG
jgi:adenylylsulfate kinase-like enzyme